MARDCAKHVILTQLMDLDMNIPILQGTKLRQREVIYLAQNPTAYKRQKWDANTQNKTLLSII